MKTSKSKALSKKKYPSYVKTDYDRKTHDSIKAEKKDRSNSSGMTTYKEHIAKYGDNRKPPQK